LDVKDDGGLFAENSSKDTGFFFLNVGLRISTGLGKDDILRVGCFDESLIVGSTSNMLSNY
jgi:hypothetical protein